MAVNLISHVSMVLVECGRLSECEHLVGRSGADLRSPLLTQTPLPPNHSALTSVAREHMEHIHFPPTEEFSSTLTIAQGVIFVKFKNINNHDNVIST